MKGIIALAAAVVLLAGCAGTPAEQPWSRWTCDSGAELNWRFADAGRDTVDLRVSGSDVVYRLQREPAASGALYSDAVIAFHAKGEEGLAYWVAGNDLIGRGCKTQ